MQVFFSQPAQLFNEALLSFLEMILDCVVQLQVLLVGLLDDV